MNFKTKNTKIHGRKNQDFTERFRASCVRISPPGLTHHVSLKHKNVTGVLVLDFIGCYIRTVPVDTLTYARRVSLVRLFRTVPCSAAGSSAGSTDAASSQCVLPPPRERDPVRGSSGCGTRGRENRHSLPLSFHAMPAWLYTLIPNTFIP